MSAYTGASAAILRLQRSNSTAWNSGTLKIMSHGWMSLLWSFMCTLSNGWCNYTSIFSKLLTNCTIWSKFRFSYSNSRLKSSCLMEKHRKLVTRLNRSNT